MKKIVYTELLDKVDLDLADIITSCKDEIAAAKIQEVRRFISDNITHDGNDIKNLVKRLLYNRMIKIKYTSRDESLEIYKIYQSLKSNELTAEEALSKFGYIKTKYNGI